MKESKIMTRLEEKFMENVPYYLRKIAEQMKIANQLKALEMKGRADLSITPEAVDEILKGK